MRKRGGSIDDICSLLIDQGRTLIQFNFVFGWDEKVISGEAGK